MIKGNDNVNTKKHDLLQNEDDQLTIQNLSNCINDKMAILNIKLPQLAKEADVDYFTLRKIVNREIDYMPNLRIILKLARYLNVKEGDLLNYQELPQYVPIIKKENILEFLNNENKKDFGFKNKVFSEKYIHDNAFAIKEVSNELLLPCEIIYICYPNQNKVLAKDQVYLFEIEQAGESKLIFSRVMSISGAHIELLINHKPYLIEKYKILAMIVSMQMSETLI